jgi:outer membrane scaffolding protein for murein synthesis (MipA/OmpV family)
MITPEQQAMTPSAQAASPAAVAPYDAGWQTVAAPTLTPVTSYSAPAPVQAGSGGSAQPPALPLWEVGFVLGTSYMPDYPAANQSSIHYLPIPVLIYRGEIFRAGDKGLVRGRLLHTRDVELDVSVNGGFPSNSDDNDARSGMPDLDWLGEVGPRLQWTVARAARNAKVDLEIPVRAVFSTDFHSDISYRGLVLVPEIAYQNAGFLDSGVGIKLGLSSTFASEDLQDYFYQVSAPYATASRAAYDAEAGYMGSKLQLSMHTALTPWVGLMGMGQVNFHQGAANENSPLFKDDTTFAVGLALSVTLAKSKTSTKAGL